MRRRPSSIVHHVPTEDGKFTTCKRIRTPEWICTSDVSKVTCELCKIRREGLRFLYTEKPKPLKEK